MIAAIGKNNELGRNNELMWHLPDDFQWFIRHTKHKTVVMGRNTMVSLGKPLKNRRNVVLSSTSADIIEGFEYANSLESVIDVEASLDTKELMIIGGGQLYAYAMHLADRIYLTQVHATFEGADTFFPSLDLNIWKLNFKEHHSLDEKHAHAFDLLIFDRIK